MAGPTAITSYFKADTRGRLMQSMKSHLASRLFRETYVFEEVHAGRALIAIILRELRSAAEAQFGDIGSRVVVGRPVHFSGAGSAEDDAFALSRLRQPSNRRGLKTSCLNSNQWRRRMSSRASSTTTTILIADFGGGTSDFSLMQVGPSVRRRAMRLRTFWGQTG